MHIKGGPEHSGACAYDLVLNSVSKEGKKETNKVLSDLANIFDCSERGVGPLDLIQALTSKASICVRDAFVHMTLIIAHP